MAYFIDMDGVLAKYVHEDYVSRDGGTPPWLVPDTHYFAKRMPDERMVAVLNALCKRYWDLFVISRMTNNLKLAHEHCEDKKAWLSIHAPELPTDRFRPCFWPKSTLAQHLLEQKLTPDDVLIDDFNDNLVEWQKAGGTAIKYCNGSNAPSTFNGPHIPEDASADDIIEMLHMLKTTLTWEKYPDKYCSPRIYH